MTDMLNVISRNFSRRHVDTLVNMITNYSDDPDKLFMIRNEFKKLPEHVSTFQKCHLQIMAHPDNVDNQDQLFNEFDAFFENVRFIELRCGVPPFKDVESVADNSTLLNAAFNNSHNRSGCSVRLPKLTIPMFSGEIASWCHFSDLFRTLVHENMELSEIEKLQYLKLNLTGEPLNVIKNLLVSSDNYQVAWELLVKRYENPRQIATHHVDNILAIPESTKLSLPNLRLLTNTLNENLAALKMLKLPVDEWGFLLTVIVLQKLDPATRHRFEDTLTDRRSFTLFSKLIDFLENQISILESLGSERRAPVAPFAPKTTHDRRSANRTFVTNTDVSIVCVLCSGNHRLFKCPDFRRKTPTDRHQVVKNRSLCFNCLDASHTARSCPSVRSCFTCKQRHHSLLHNCYQNSVGSAESTSATDSEIQLTNTSVTTLASYNSPRATVLLPTALVEVQDVEGKGHQIRVLLDCASQASYITESCIQRLGLRRRKLETPIYALGEVPIKAARGITHCKISPLGKLKPSFETTAIVVNSITGSIPAQWFDLNSFSHLKSLKLSDPQVSTPAKVDMLFGADLFPQITLGGRIIGPAGSPSALETVFGWVLIGQMHMPDVSPVNTFQPMLETPSLEHILNKFWEVEEITTKQRGYLL